MSTIYYLTIVFVSVIFLVLCIFMFVIFLISVAKHLESANTMFSFIWWIIGFYWVSAGGQALAQDSPQLYWFVLPQRHSISLFIYLLSNISFIIYSPFSKYTLIYLFWLITSLQAMYNLPWFRCFLCRFLYCTGMHHWYRCLLLSSMYHCSSLCSCRPGMHVQLVSTCSF